jgi:hypothetical protein
VDDTGEATDDGTGTATGVSRRRLLWSLGAVGTAGALGGGGSVALFADEERFANDRLTAGSLDLTVGWAEYYVDWLGDERRVAGVRHVAEGTDPRADEVGFPAGDPVLAVPAGDTDGDGVPQVEELAAATLRERYPPGDGDSETPSDPCASLADRPADGGPRPLVDLSDVKPGDAGEVAFDLALCEDPGYVWLTARLVGSAERGLLDPERADPDEYSDDAPAGGDAPVLTIANDVLEVAVSTDASGALAGQPWTYTFPDGREERFLFFEIYALRDDDARGATEVGAFEAAFPAQGVPGTTYPGTYTVRVDGVETAVTRAFTLDPVDALLTVDYRFENVDEATLSDLRLTQYVDYDVGQFANTDAGRFRSDDSRAFDRVEQRGLPGFGTGLVAGFAATRPATAHQVGQRSAVLADAFDAAPLAGADAYDGDVGFALEYSVGELAPGDTARLRTAFAVARSSLALRASLLKPRLALDGDLADAVRTTLRDGDGGVAFEGSLAQLLALASSGRGLPLHAGGADTTAPGGPDRASGAGGCLAPSPAVHRPSLAWALPVDHANEVQTDSVEFDLGFYVEQCRHNDGR